MMFRFQATVVFAATLALTACAEMTLPKVSGVPRRPHAMESVRISGSLERAGYIEATLETADGPLRFYFPGDATCRAVVTDGAEVEYGGSGALGHVAGAAGECETLGTGSLREWQARRPEQRERGKPRANARFEKIYEDGEVLLARGRFPLARMLGWMSDDLVAVLPAGPECRSVVERGEAFMIYHRAGDAIFVLTGGESRCELIGLTQPLRR